MGVFRLGFSVITAWQTSNFTFGGMLNGRYEHPVRHIWLFTTTKLYVPIDRSLALWLVGLHWAQLHFIESRFMSLQFED